MENKVFCIPIKRIGRFLLLGAFFMLFLNAIPFAQQRSVTGTVTSSSDGLPLPGVTVTFKGTASKTLTNTEGQFSLDIPTGDVSLQFSFTGFIDKVVKVGTSTVFDVSLKPGLKALEEVVVTSFGKKREKSRITYSVQNVSPDEIFVARELNVVNSLQGRVAGMDIIRSSSGLGSATRVVLRGNRSIAGNNQPLYILDGVPIQNFTWNTPNSEQGGLQGGDGISNINPDDIASITVLKGPNAAALYGSRAANGAIVITTRQGSIRKGIGVEFNTNVAMEKAMILTKYQHVYGQGSSGVYINNTSHGWGPKMEGQMVDHWSNDLEYDGVQYAYLPHHNFEEFFQTGLNIANTLTLTSGSEKVKTFFSYTSTAANGIVEHNKLKRHNFNLRVDGNLTDRLSFDTKLTYFNQRVDNRLTTGDDYNNPIKTIYLQPSNISLEEARRFEYFDASGERQQNRWTWSAGPGNVYWMLNRTIRDEDRNRILGMGSLRYSFTDNLSLMVRSSFDQIYENELNKIYNSTVNFEGGNFSLDNRSSLEFNGDFLLNYNNIWGDGTFSLDVSFGGNMLIHNSKTLNAHTNRLLKPNLFVITNTSRIRSEQGGSEKQVNSLYGFATLGFKDYLFLHLTGRNDWSSTLPKDNWSYFYPSAGLSWIITEMIGTNTGILTFAKVRASYAEVGNDTDPYMLHKTYSYRTGGGLGYVSRDSSLPLENLKPENTKSIELGFDIRFFNHRLGLDFTWYKSNTFNQLLSIPLPQASGYTSKFINAGNVQNIGIELTLNATPVRIGDFSWNISFNYAQNENRVIELTPEFKEYTIRERSWATTIKVVEGGLYNEIYTRGIMRNEQGRVLIGWGGWPITNPYQIIPQGNYDPDWLGGVSNTFSYNGITLSVLIDMRMGGKIFSFTECNLTFDGHSEQTLYGRKGYVVDGVLPDGRENTIEITAEEYWHSLGGRNSPIGEHYMYDASYVRIREVLLGYSFRLKSNVIQGIDLALYGRNLGFFYHPAEIIDPNQTVGIGNVQGLEGFSIPSTSTYGLNARFKF